MNKSFKLSDEKILNEIKMKVNKDKLVMNWCCGLGRNGLYCCLGGKLRHPELNSSA